MRTRNRRFQSKQAETKEEECDNHTPQWEQLLRSSVRCLKSKVKSTGTVMQQEVKLLPPSSRPSLLEPRGKPHSLYQPYASLSPFSGSSVLLTHIAWPCQEPVWRSLLQTCTHIKRSLKWKQNNWTSQNFQQNVSALKKCCFAKAQVICSYTLVVMKSLMMSENWHYLPTVNQV